MKDTLELSKVSWETNSDLWEVSDDVSDRLFRLAGNSIVDMVGGKVLLFKVNLGSYRMRAEMRFLDHHLLEEEGGWFGFVMHARDTENYELVWFMPFADQGKSAAYLSVAHGIVPWWTEAYSSQEKKGPKIHHKKWFEAELEVLGDEFTLFMAGQKVFNKKLTYYLDEGYPGFYVGTATDAEFREVEIERLSG